MTLSSGWYVVANIDTLPEKTSIIINGEVNIVLMDDRSLTLPKPAYHKSGNYMSAMVVTSGNTLNIYGQTKGTGTLTANGFNSAAGIGGWGYYDNKAVIAIVHNPVFHDRTKHVEVDKHFIKEKIEEGIICMPYVPTS